jgi:NADH-quinone oxidoreductase subunit J
MVLPRYLVSIQGNAVALGKLLFQDYALPFELSSVLFLSAVVGVVMLGKRS